VKISTLNLFQIQMCYYFLGSI